MSNLIGAGGGGSSLPNGGNPADILAKHSIIDGDVSWLPFSAFPNNIGAPVLLGTATGIAASIVITTGADAPAGGAIIVVQGNNSAQLFQATGIVTSAGDSLTSNNIGPTGIAATTWFKENCTHLPLGGTITITQPAAGDGSLFIAFYIPGVKTSGSLDKNTLFATASGGAIAEASGTLAVPMEIIICALCAGNGDVTTWAPKTPLTRIAFLQSLGGAGLRWLWLDVGYAIVAGTQTTNYEFDPTGPNQSRSFNLSSYKSA